MLRRISSRGNCEGICSLKLLTVPWEGVLECGSSLLKKVVIPAAGLGTRLLSVTKEQPKEMLPVFAKGKNGDLCLKPIVQLVFEQLYHVGFREFCFILGLGDRAIEDHFTPDFSFVSMLDSKGKDGPASDLENFYTMIDS